MLNFFILLGVLFNFSVFSQNLESVKSEKTFKEIPSINHSAIEYLTEVKNPGDVTRFIFIRHGESNSNKEKSMAGRTLNTDLSENGIMQALETGQKLSQALVAIDHTYLSPTLRTTQTAEQILVTLNPLSQLIYDERLHEKWYGPYEGASESEYAIVKKREEIEIPLLPTFAEKFAFKAHPEMESMQDIYIRVLDFIQDVRKIDEGRDVLIVTHNGGMKALFMADAALCGYDVEYRAFDLANCSILIVETRPNGEMKVVASNGLKFKK